MRQLKRTSQYGLCVALALVACTCSGSKAPTISLTASPTTLVIGETTAGGQVQSVALTATGTDSGSPWVDSSVDVEFQTDWGSFDPPSDMDSMDNQDTQVEISGHDAIVKLYPDSSPPKGNIAHVTAIYVDTAGTKVQATVSITVQTSSIVASLSFNCLSGNIGAFANQSALMEVGCSVQALDSGGKQVLGVPVSFLAEAGAIQYDSMYNTYAYFPFRTGPGNVEGNQPLDVMPIGAEPSYVDMSDPQMKTRNPRDGLVTMIAYTPSDATNSGALQGEPYVDVDDSGAYHAGDPFVDLNGNGTWDSSQTSVIWVQTKILWTGSLQMVSNDTTYDPTFDGTDVGDGVDLQYGMQATLSWYLLDQNLNLIAANDNNNDTVNWDCTPEPNVDPLGNLTTLLNSSDSKRYGMLMDQYGNLTDPNDLSSWAIGSQVSLLVQNESACESGATAEPFTCYGSVSRSLWLDAQGSPAGQISGESTQTIAGTAEPDPPSCLNSGD